MADPSRPVSEASQSESLSTVSDSSLLSGREARSVGRVLRAIRATPELTYLQRVRKYASDETREFLWRDLPVEMFAAAAYGLYQAGWSLEAFLHGLVGFLILFVGAYVIHLGHAPRALDLARLVEIDVLGSSLTGVQAALVEERTAANLDGQFHQVYISDSTFDDEGCCFYLTIQASLWNTRNVPTSVREFGLTVFTDNREFDGKKISSSPFSYFEKANEANSFYDVVLPIEESEMPYNPLPDGYKRGQPQREKWLRFRVAITWDDVMANSSSVAKGIIRIILIAVDTEGVTHEIIEEPPWVTKGEVDFSPFDTTATDNIKMFYALVDLHGRGKVYYEQSRQGRSLVPDYEIENWVKAVGEALREWRGKSYEIEFSSLEDKLPTVELVSTPAEHRKRSAFLHPRLEKLVEYMKALEEK